MRTLFQRRRHDPHPSNAPETDTSAPVNNELESSTHADEATLAGLLISIGYLRARVSAEKTDSDYLRDIFSAETRALKYNDGSECQIRRTVDIAGRDKRLFWIGFRQHESDLNLFPDWRAP